MDKFTLIGGTKSASSWTLRVWLMLKHAKVNFEEIIVPLYHPTTQTEILKYSPAGKVPLLIHNDLLIHDSLAIGEYLHELFPEAKLLPVDRNERAMARSLCSEMHSGFVVLRKLFPFTLSKKSYIPMVNELQQDIDRMVQIWCEYRKQYSTKGKYLFGQFSMVDAMFAPVVLRFKYYGIELNNPLAQQYAQIIWNNELIQQWINDAE